MRDTNNVELQSYRKPVTSLVCNTMRHQTCARGAISKIRTARGSWGRQIHTLVNTWQKEIEEEEILKIAISIFILLQYRSYIKVPCSLSFQSDDCSQDYLGPAASGVTQAY